MYNKLYYHSIQYIYYPQFLLNTLLPELRRTACDLPHITDCIIHKNASNILDIQYIYIQHFNT